MTGIVDNQGFERRRGPLVFLQRRSDLVLGLGLLLRAFARIAVR